MTAKKRPGRPKLRVGDRSSEIVTLRVRRADKQRMDAAAHAAGMTFSAWARKTLTEAI